MDSSSFKSRFPGDLTISWKAPKVHSLHSQGFAGIFSPISNNLKLNSFVVAMTKAATAQHLAHESLSVYKQQFQESPFPVFLNTCTKKLLSQEFLGPLCVHCMIFPVEFWEVKITPEGQGSWQRYSLILCWLLGCSQWWWGWCEGWMNAITRESHLSLLLNSSKWMSKWALSKSFATKPKSKPVLKCAPITEPFSRKFCSFSVVLSFFIHHHGL